MNHHETELTDGFAVRRGWSDTLAEELVEVSRQSHILKHTPNDAARRFVDSGSAREWYEGNERHIYTLRKDEKLAGIVWFSRNEQPQLGADYTFAIRVYQEALGQGMSEPLMRQAHDDFLASHPDTSVWLATDWDNKAALKLYDKFGYEKVGATDDGRITMLYQQD